MLMSKLHLNFFLLFLLASGYNDRPDGSANSSNGKTSVNSSREIASPKYEMRGAWLTTVVNLDWPSSRTLDVETQKKELVKLMDDLYSNGFNAVFFQVRSEADAMYPSPYEPWSYYLTNEQGKAPDPFYDPLEFAIELAHERGMELHAWLNPFRTSRDLGGYKINDSHIIRAHPEWILNFRGSTTYSMLNPGIAEVREYVALIVSDIVRRYKVDGVHFDDYFYPYSPPISTEDDLHFKADQRGFANISDWRRDNIHVFVRQIRDSIYSIDPMVKFGISPFGIRLNEDAGTNGSEGYHLIYADSKSWLTEGIIDYIAPQLYWENGHKLAPYQPLMEYWSKEAVENSRHIYVGLAPYRLGPPFNWDISELSTMLQLNRQNENQVHGSIFFRTLSVTDNPKGVSDSLKVSWFRNRALVPSMDWKPSSVVFPVGNLSAARPSDAMIKLEWIFSENAVRYVVYRFEVQNAIEGLYGLDNSSNIIGVTGFCDFRDTQISPDGKYVYAVTAVGRNGEESEPRFLHVK
jgi:uncharacterized lipoprotein YddW (UPF0748 family)